MFKINNLKIILKKFREKIRFSMFVFIFPEVYLVSQ